MSQQQPVRMAIAAFTSVVYGVSATFLLLFSLFTMGSADQKGKYCESIDHVSPCSRLQAMSTGDILPWIVAVFVSVLTGALVLIVGWWLPARRRGWTGAVLVALSFLGLFAACAILFHLHG